MKSTLTRALVLSLAAVLLVGGAAWAGEEKAVWVTDEGEKIGLHGHRNAMFIAGDGNTFDLSDLLEGQTRTFGEGEKQVTVTRDGDVVTINRDTADSDRNLEIKCRVDSDTCQIMTFDDSPEKVMIVVKKTRECINGVGDCDTTVDVTLDSLDFGEGAHAIIRKVECDHVGNCEEFETMHDGGLVEIIADMDHGGGHPNIMIMRTEEMDGKVALVCPEGDATVRVASEQADDTFLCPQHSVPMEQAAENKFVHKIRIHQEAD